ncbi:MAG: hypothetical protein IKW06_01635 [Clostridia bacterium]|nr:hypothetical protein [Clostridia bacterium]
MQKSSRCYVVIYIAVMLLMICTGCTQQNPLTDRDADIYQRIHKKFSRMTAYTARVEVTVYSNKTENTYLIKELMKDSQGAQLMIEKPESVQGTITRYHNGQVTMMNAGQESAVSVPAAEAYHDIFIDQFFALYYQSEKTAINTSSAGTEGANSLLLETIAVPDASHRHRLTLLIDATRLEPQVLTVYDVGGNIQLIAKFIEFQYNPSIDDSLFVSLE